MADDEPHFIPHLSISILLKKLQSNMPPLLLKK
jgi:hypothetical protein